MSSLVDKLENGQEEEVDLADVVCPICLSLYVEPVKMPCRHVLCLSCFNNNVSQATLSCPLCRKRIGSFGRRGALQKTLVDQQLWEFIQMRFPVHVESREAGEDDVDPEEVFPCVPVHQFAQQGDIKTEFDTELQKVTEEERLRRESEEREGSKLAEKIEAEERERLEAAEEQEFSDLQLARKMWRDITSTPASSKKRKLSVIDLMRKSAEKKTKKETNIPSEEPRSPEDMLLNKPENENNSPREKSLSQEEDISTKFSDEKFLAEQKELENKLAQERSDEDLARKLARDLLQSPTTTKTPNCKGKSSGRQLSLFECSSKPVREAEECRLDKPAAPDKLNSRDKENNNAENATNQSNVLNLFKKKVEDDLNRKVTLQSGGGSFNPKMSLISDQEERDAELARKLQQEEEASTSSATVQTGEGRVVRNVFEVLSKSQQSQSNAKYQACHHRNQPCRRCDNCLRSNCGTCTSCRDMPQFGGKGLIKQSCLHRKCLRPIKGKCGNC